MAPGANAQCARLSRVLRLLVTPFALGSYCEPVDRSAKRAFVFVTLKPIIPFGNLAQDCFVRMAYIFPLANLCVWRTMRALQ